MRNTVQPGSTLLAAFLLVACTSACSKHDAPAPAKSAPPAALEQPQQQEERDEPAVKTKSPKTEPKPIDPATVGTIRGVVRFEGAPPVRKEMAIGNTAGCEHHPVPPLTEDLIAENGRVQNVFVHVKQGLDGWILPAPPSEGVILDQKGCMYRPRVLGMRVGQTLRVKNADGATHNVHARPERNDAFNRTQPPGGADVEWTPEKPELMVPFGCDVHPWMKAWVGVRDHPFFAVSAADGSFAISGLPPGAYVLEAWHEKLGKKSEKVALAASGTADIEFTFSAK